MSKKERNVKFLGNNLAKLIEKNHLKTDLKKCLDFLTEREKGILINRFGLNGNKIKTLEELGLQYGFSKERIRQLEGNILAKIKNNKNVSHLKDYLN